MISAEQAREKNDFIAVLEAEMSERDLLGELKADKHKKEDAIN
jgi:hypothetical protein